MAAIPQFEKDLVINCYNTKANEFSGTRHTRWEEVEYYINGLPPSHILDVGCGNGKNMFNRYPGDKTRASSRCAHVISKIEHFPTHVWSGCDVSEELVKICKSRDLNVLTADICALPYKSNEFDAIISIAVIHHLSSDLRRLTAMQEINRVLKPGGSCLISILRDTYGLKNGDAVIDINYPRDVSISFQECPRYYHLFIAGEFDQLIKQVPELSIISICEEPTNYYYQLKKMIIE